MRRAVNGQLSLPSYGPDAADPFRFTWWSTREGAACWIEHHGRWRAGVIVQRGRKYVRVVLTERGGRTVHVRRRYGELRRRVARPVADFISS
jgi:hypothetical protein